jgi:hypothetical protein
MRRRISAIIVRIPDEHELPTRDASHDSAGGKAARRLVRAQPLRTADSRHLAAALTFGAHFDTRIPMVCLGARLADAARREELSVVR